MIILININDNINSNYTYDYYYCYYLTLWFIFGMDGTTEPSFPWFFYLMLEDRFLVESAPRRFRAREQAGWGRRLWPGSRGFRRFCWVTWERFGAGHGSHLALGSSRDPVGADLGHLELGPWTSRFCIDFWISWRRQLSSKSARMEDGSTRGARKSQTFRWRLLRGTGWSWCA